MGQYAMGVYIVTEQHPSNVNPVLRLGGDHHWALCGSVGQKLNGKGDESSPSHTESVGSLAVLNRVKIINVSMIRLEEWTNSKDDFFD